MKKYLIQVLVVLALLVSAWGLLSLSSKVPKETKEDVELIEANIQQIVRLPISPDFFPIRNWSIEEPEITAKAAAVVSFKSENKNSNEEGNILYQKNKDDVLSIASLTKIMTAIIVLENFDLEEVIKVSQDSVLTEGDKGNLIRGEELTIKDLLYIMLIESSNDAAMALANDNPYFSYENFINLMNIKAKELGLENTEFLDPIGLNSKNNSTTIDLIYLGRETLEFPFLWEILKTLKTTVYSIDNKFVHNLVNTNQLLEKISSLVGKTGYTEEANGCMLTIFNISDSYYLIAVVLGSDQRETDTETLINWSKQAYLW